MTDLTPAEVLVLKKSTLDGYITADVPTFSAVLQKLERKQLVKHVRALVYKLTPDGEEVRRSLR